MATSVLKPVSCKINGISVQVTKSLGLIKTKDVGTLEEAVALGHAALTGKRKVALELNGDVIRVRMHLPAHLLGAEENARAGAMVSMDLHLRGTSCWGRLYRRNLGRGPEWIGLARLNLNTETGILSIFPNSPVIPRNFGPAMTQVFRILDSAATIGPDRTEEFAVEAVEYLLELAVKHGVPLAIR